jgi:peptide subunit release factor RF-3
MYSPKISEDLIPKIYRVAKATRMPMTKLVNQILRETLDKIEVITEVEEVEVTTIEPRETYRIHRGGEDEQGGNVFDAVRNG